MSSMEIVGFIAGALVGIVTTLAVEIILMRKNKK